MKTLFNFSAFVTFLRRNKLYTAINIFGFSVSLMFVILLGSYSLRELSTDRFHANKDRVFRLEQARWSSFAAPVGQDLQSRYPEIECFTRLQSIPTMLETYNHEKVEAVMLMVDPAFFRIFSYPLLQGDTSQLLRNQQSAVFSETFARKAFGSTDVIGKTYVLNETLSVTVEGIIGDFGKSHLATPDIILAFDKWAPLMMGEKAVTDYEKHDFGLYLMCRPGTDFQAKKADILSFFQSYYSLYVQKIYKSVYLTPLTDVYYSKNGNQFIYRSGAQSLINVSFAVALLILLFAMINYINLSVSQAEFRAKEMATRRLLGSTRTELYIRLIVESMCICLVSCSLGILLAKFTEPYFDNLLQTDIAIGELLTPLHLLYLIGGTLLLGALSGVIPAAVLSNYRPIEVVRGTLRRKARMVYGKILIGFQYFITIILIGCAITMARQIKFMVNADLGYDTSNLMFVFHPLTSTEQNVIRNELLRVPGVESVSFCNGSPTTGGRVTLGSYHDKPFNVWNFYGDSTFVRTFGLKVLRDNALPDANAVWINETAVDAFDLTDSSTFSEYLERPIAGIVKDFNYRTFSYEIDPIVIHPNQQEWGTGTTAIRISSVSLQKTSKTIEAVFQKYKKGNEIYIRFANEIIQQQYAIQQRLLEVVTCLSVIAIIISALGIFAMATYFIRQRSMEIAIRKVYGSTNRQILAKLIFNFVRYVLIALLAAIPFIVYMMHKWLESYVYKISLSWTIFALAGLIALAIALFVIFGQSWKAANTNPVDSIKR